jgi:tetratricopeptide (TPR) repeat protein
MRSTYSLRPRVCSLTIGLCLIVAGPLRADGPGAHAPRERPRTPTVALADELEAIDAYNNGYASIQRAEHYEALGGASQGAERARALQGSRDAYKASLAAFKSAVRLDGSMHEAHTYIGYANRKLGRHAEALTAYAEALRLNPDYPYAIEYQGQAFLGLNRIDEAKFNYLRLYALNPAQAHKLLRAMQAWVEANAAKPPANVDVAALKAWVAEREQTHDPNESSSGW